MYIYTKYAFLWVKTNLCSLYPDSLRLRGPSFVAKIYTLVVKLHTLPSCISLRSTLPLCDICTLSLVRCDGGDPCSLRNTPPHSDVHTLPSRLCISLRNTPPRCKIHTSLVYIAIQGTLLRCEICALALITRYTPLLQNEHTLLSRVCISSQNTHLRCEIHTLPRIRCN